MATHADAILGDDGLMALQSDSAEFKTGTEPMMVPFDGPCLERQLHLNFQGDWGQANFHVVCGWLSQTICDRAGKGSRVAIWNGKGGSDAPSAVSRGEVDLAISTPARFATMAVNGTGPHAGAPKANLRAIGVLPQDDRLVFALRRELGISSFAEIRERKPPLRLVVSVDDDSNHIGYLTHRWLEAAGIPISEVQRWGGKVYQAERPETCLELFALGEIDGVIQEAIMTPWWHEDLDGIQLTFVPIEETVLTQLEQELGVQRNTLPAGYFRDLDFDLTALDFSDFIILVRDDMPDDLAYLIAWCFTDRREELESRYRHLPPRRSPMTYPLLPELMVQSPIPLHRGAERVYREKGYIRA